jgi:putative NADPH-quinone reductase
VNILVLQGHPDPAGGHYLHALADAYAHGAGQAGHAVRRIEVARLDLPRLHSQHDYEHGEVPPAAAAAQAELRWAEHLVILYPLWLGTLPSVLQGFFEQVFRPGFAARVIDPRTGRVERLLAGRSARVVVTMGMPALAYRWWFRKHSLASLERNLLGFVGIAPIHETLIGSVEAIGPARRTAWLAKVRALGAQAR